MSKARDGTNNDATAEKTARPVGRAPVRPVRKVGSRLPRPRLLPIVIFAIGLMLTVKLGGLWEDVNGARHSVTLVPTQAQAQPAAAAPPTPAKHAPPVTAAQTSPVPQNGGEKTADPATGNQKSLGDPATFTQNEINLLQKLAERREELDGRSREMDARGALIDAAEASIDKKIAEIKTLQQTILKLISQYNQLEDNKLKSLVNIYEKMKPKDAARIFNDLEMPTLMAVIERMKDTKTAPIMAEMDSAKAKALTSELAQRNRMPNVAEAGGT